MNRFGKVIVVLLLAALSCSCSKIREIHLTSYSVESYSPVGLRGLDLVLKLGIDNPAIQFTVYDVCAELYRGDTKVGTFVTTDPVLVKGRTVGYYDVGGQVRLADGVSLLSALSMMASFKVEEYSLTYSAKVKIRGGAHVTLSKKNVPLKELFE